MVTLGNEGRKKDGRKLHQSHLYGFILKKKRQSILHPVCYRQYSTEVQIMGSGGRLSEFKPQSARYGWCDFSAGLEALHASAASPVKWN